MEVKLYCRYSFIPFVHAFFMKRFALVGLGDRAEVYIRGITGRYSSQAELSALFDLNQGRMDWYKQKFGLDADSFSPSWFKMAASGIDSRGFDSVIIASPDNTHTRYVLDALQMNKEVIVEKPLATSVEDLRKIAAAAVGREGAVKVTHNLRYSEAAHRLQEVVQSGEIGELTSISATFLLNTSHGADYFRRWNSDSSKSGSMWVHKGSHHFDLLTWLTGLEVVRVDSAHQERKVYGDAGKQGGDRCLTCEDRCNFYIDISRNSKNAGLWLSDKEYSRDSCVFSPRIDTHDHMRARLMLSNGAVLNYNLEMANPLQEGVFLSFFGTEGVVDFFSTDRLLCNRFYHPFKRKWHTPKHPVSLELTRNGTRKQIKIKKYGRGHDEEDRALLDSVFSFPGSQPLATLQEASGAVLVGIAARTSAEQERRVAIDEL